MENTEQIIEKLMLIRTKLMMARFDKELKDIIDGDLKALRSKDQQLSDRQTA